MNRAALLGLGAAGALIFALLGTVLVQASRGPSAPVVFTVPSGAVFTDVLDTLEQRGVIHGRGLFHLYARLRAADRRVRSGQYNVQAGASWNDVLDALVRGRVETVALTIPEGFWLTQMAPRIAAVTERPEAEVLAILTDTAAPRRYGVPGPTLEGYLFPDTYRFARGVPPERVVEAMVARYKQVWTPRRRARLDSLGMTEREVVTLASIVQAEARKVEEMPTIASVYHNRLEKGWLLQADPTVLYALGGRRERLLYAAIDSVADNPYNTYSQRGLPPGPIGAPGELAIEAALFPAETEFMYFVARPDGSHVFTRTLREHNREKEGSRRQLDGREEDRP